MSEQDSNSSAARERDAESKQLDGDAPEQLSLTDEQEAALALDHNIAITAGAGTGKTTTLTERYRRILRRNPDLDPRSVVTITFTNDATSELQERIREVIDAELEAADAERYTRWRDATDAAEDA
jgi:ATP-dependent helicase/nuclease subunit A